jgi:hypothetical protein
MKVSTQSLPEGYQPTKEINLAKDKVLAIALNVAGIILFLIVFGGLGWLVNRMRPGLMGDTLTINIGIELVWWLLALVGLTLGNLVVHELIHGFFFWLFTGSLPKFGLSLTYAYAAAPSWYIPRSYYRIIGLAPLVIIGLVCLLLIAVAPVGWIVPLALVISLNTSGAVGDLLIIAVVNRSAPDCLINDRGDGVIIYEKTRADT